MFRFFFLIVALSAAVLWIEPQWTASNQTLSLRVRTSQELAGRVQQLARDLGGRAVAAIEQRSTPSAPSVGAAPPESGEHLTNRDREQLNRLIEEKTRR